MTYLYRLMYAFGHLHVAIPSLEGYYHWYVFKLGYFILSVLGIGFLLGYMTKFLGSKKCPSKKKCRSKKKCH